MILTASLMGILLTTASLARRFYPDDPIAKEPPPLAVGDLHPDTSSDFALMIRNMLLPPGERVKSTPAVDINTIDEVPDNAWFTNRHYVHPLTDSRLELGPGGNEPPATDKPWVIYEADEGDSPILRIEDSAGRRFALRFDPLRNIELSTGADVVGSKLLYAIGYNVPDDYAVRFGRNQIRAGENIRFNRNGHRVPLREADVDHLLSLTPRYPNGEYRALASRLIDGTLLGPFAYSSTREDDPNDIVPHERLRVLRGLFVFSAWLDLTDTRALGTLDTIQLVDGVRAVRHYLTDFGSALGSGNLRPKEAWEGHTYAVDLRWGLREMFTLGAWSPKWERSQAGELPAAGRYDGATFEPAKWKPAYPNPAFTNRTIADCFWAAKQIKAFTDDQIRAIVSSGHYSDPKTVHAIVDAMILRRDKIAAWYFDQTLPLDGFEARDGVLHFRDLGGNGNYRIDWSLFDNETEAYTPIAGAGTFEIPQAPGYLAADVSDGTHTLTVYVKDNRVVGLLR